MPTDASHPLVALALVAALVGTALPTAAQTMSQSEFESTLAGMQSDVDAAVEAYRAGNVDEARARARDVTEHFTFGEDGASPLERKIKEASAVAIGEEVKGLASKLENAIDTERPVDEVEEVADDLHPSLNRLVLVAKGKTSPASQRQLRTEEEIRAAADAVLDELNRSVELYAAGDVKEAKSLAREAFFTYETNGLGPDTSVVDEPLENDLENMIVQHRRGGPPGLAGLMNASANLSTIEDHRDRIVLKIEESVELLEATLPPLSLGDANGDGKVSIVDALVTSQAALGIRQPTDGMDVNRDGRVTIVDALMISQAALGIRTL